VNVADGGSILGRFAGGGGEHHLLELKSRAVHVNFVGFYPIADRWDAMGSIGLSRVNLTGYDTILQGPGVGYDHLSKLYSKTKGILELGAGIKYMLNSSFAMRVMINWQNKSKLESLSGVYGADPLFAKIKNSVKLGVGILYYPCSN
jgi:hypothetical protein